MGTVLGRDDWSQIIQEINDLSANPPSGSTAFPAPSSGRGTHLDQT